MTTADGRLQMSYPTFTAANQTNISTFYQFTSFQYTQSQPSFNFTITQPADAVFTAAATSMYYESATSNNGRKLLSIQSACDATRMFLVVRPVHHLLCQTLAHLVAPTALPFLSCSKQSALLNDFSHK